MLLPDPRFLLVMKTQLLDRREQLQAIAEQVKLKAKRSSGGWGWGYEPRGMDPREEWWRKQEGKEEKE